MPTSASDRDPRPSRDRRVAETADETGRRSHREPVRRPTDPPDPASDLGSAERAAGTPLETESNAPDDGPFPTPEGVSDRRGRPAAAHHRRTIERAVAATRDLERAAEFARTVGFGSLEGAVRAAEGAGADETAARGRRALRAFDRFRRAARGAAGPSEGES